MKVGVIWKLEWSGSWSDLEVGASELEVGVI